MAQHLETEDLLKDFKPQTKEQWRQKIEKDLRGKDFQSLVSTTADGLHIQPIYHPEDADPKPQTFRENSEWKIVQEILVLEAKAANREALHQLNRGANSLLFYVLPDVDLKVLLENIQLNLISVHFVTEGNGAEIAEKLKAVISDQGLDEKSISGSINIDCLENLARTGNFFKNKEADLREVKELLKTAPENMKSVCVNANLFGNAGATLSQQLGIALSMVYEYVHRLELKSLKPFWINFAVGSDYFGEIAKLRAFRRIWELLADELDMEKTSAHIYCESGLRNKTILDRYNNMIRTTSEAMAAVIGGADEVSVKGFDVTFRDSSPFGERIAKNQLHILQHESHLNEVKDIAQGAYFIEELTEKLAEMGWDFFKKIEAEGGYLAALETGWLQNEISASAEREQAAFDDQEKVLIGANKYTKGDENLKEIIERGLFSGDDQKETKVKRVKVVRLSEKAEREKMR